MVPLPTTEKKLSAIVEWCCFAILNISLHHLSNRWINRGTKVTHDLYKYKPWHKKRVLHSTISMANMWIRGIISEWCATDLGVCVCTRRTFECVTIEFPLFLHPTESEHQPLRTYWSCTLSLAKRGNWNVGKWMQVNRMMILVVDSIPRVLFSHAFSLDKSIVVYGF